MADVRAVSGIPPLAAFNGALTPTPSTPLIVDSATGDLYADIGESVTRVAASGAAAGLTATGSDQAHALAVTALVNEFTTVAANTGAILTAGPFQAVYNGGTNALRVYPPSSAKINQLATNAPVLLNTNTAALFFRLSATKWIGVLSA